MLKTPRVREDWRTRIVFVSASVEVNGGSFYDTVVSRKQIAKNSKDSLIMTYNKTV